MENAPRDYPVPIPSEYELAQMALEPLRALIRWYSAQVGRHYTLQAVQAALVELEADRQGESCGSRRSSR